jgi:hypothetical protein
MDIIISLPDFPHPSRMPWSKTSDAAARVFADTGKN